MVPQAAVPEPRESALGILLRRSREGATEVLFARRSPRSRFMPRHLAFPGGRLEPRDEPDRPGAHARCAAREIAEEVGIEIDPAALVAIGERTTPPMFPVRFRTLFFVAEIPPDVSPPDAPPQPDEIDLLRFADAGTVLREWERGESLVPPPCLPLLREIDRRPPGPALRELSKRLEEINRVEDLLPRLEFDPGICVLPVRTRTIPPATHTNVWMPGGSRFLIIDPGSDESWEIERLLGVIERRRAEGATPDSIVLTHHHPDHVGGVGRLCRTTGLPVRAHPEVLSRLRLPPGTPAPRPLDEGERIDLGGMTARALHTPGHAPGHLAFEIPERKSAIVGDLLSGVSTILIHPDEGDMAVYLRSLERIRSLDCRRLLPAHGPPLPARAAEATIEHRMQRESRVRDGLSGEWRDVAAVAVHAYSDAPDLPAVLLEGQTRSHLLHLEKQGVARRNRDNPELWALA